MAKPAKWGAEFLVNTATAKWQTSPTIVGLDNGRFLVAWEDYSGKGGDASGSAIRAQVFDALGRKSGAEFLVNGTTADLQYQPYAVSLADGRFAVAWNDLSRTGGDTIGAAVRGQAFNADGTTSGAEFLANTATLNFQNVTGEVGALSGGRFVVAWSDDSSSGGDTSSWAVRAQILNPDGSKFGGEILVNTATAGSQIDPAATGLVGGGFLVAWQDEPAGVDTDGNIRAQIFDAGGGKVGLEFLVNTTTAGEQYDPTATVLSDGRLVVTWTDSSRSGGDTRGDAVRGQVFKADGSKSGGEFLVNTTTAGDQTGQVVAALADGRFVVAWSDGSETGRDKDGGAIRAQVFAADGSKSGGEFLVNTTTKKSQGNPSITPLADGRFVVAWGDDSRSGADKSKAAVRAQIFDPREEAVALDGSDLGDGLVGTRFGDTIDGAGGDDVLDGGRGADTLTGGPGEDDFAFTAALNGKTGIDTITDFAAGDAILLDNAVFDGIGKAGNLKGKAFHVGGKAHDRSDRIVYDDATGTLLYDRNGNEKGGVVKFAKLAPGLDLGASDIFVI